MGASARLKTPAKCGGGYRYAPVHWAKDRFEYIVAFDRASAPNFGLTPPSIVTSPSQNATFVASPLLEVTLSAP